MSSQPKRGQKASQSFHHCPNGHHCRAQPPMPIYTNSSHPPSLPDSSAAATEKELRDLVDYICTTIPKAPSGDIVSEILSFSGTQTSCLEVLDEWFDNLGRSLSPPLIARIKHLVTKLRENMALPMGLPEMLRVLKDHAMGVETLPEWSEEELLRARKALFLSEEEIQNKEYPCPKRLKTSHVTIQPVRRSTRTPEISLPQLEKDVIRKRVGIGEDFQVYVPVWTGPPNEEDPDDLRLLGTKIWPVDDRDVIVNMVGNGRPEPCRCKSAGSVACVKHHIRTSRMRLQSELGQVFASWKFDDMGEEVARSWTSKEQKMFHELVIKHPPSEGESFWKPALEHFCSKSSQEIASYYFNVYVLRRMRDQIRSATGEVDSDDDESNIAVHDHESNTKYLQSYSKSS